MLKPFGQELKVFFLQQKKAFRERDGVVGPVPLETTFLHEQAAGGLGGPPVTQRPPPSAMTSQPSSTLRSNAGHLFLNSNLCRKHHRVKVRWLGGFMRS